MYGTWMWWYHPRLDFQICCWQDIYLHRSQHLEQVAVFCAQCSISVCFQKGTQISSVSTNVIFGYEFLLCFSFVFCFYLCIFLCHRAVIFGNGALKKPLVCMYMHKLSNLSSAKLGVLYFLFLAGLWIGICIKMSQNYRREKGSQTYQNYTAEDMEKVVQDVELQKRLKSLWAIWHSNSIDALRPLVKKVEKVYFQVPDTGTRVLDNTRPFLCSSILSFWIILACSKER